MASLQKIEGIGVRNARQLAKAGVRSVEALLEKGSTPRGRKELEEATGISAGRILEWVNRADLFRVKGVGEEYADLLEAAGVDTVPELARRSPQKLMQRLEEVNQEKKLVRRLPAETVVARWVEAAKQLPRKIRY